MSGYHRHFKRVSMTFAARFASIVAAILAAGRRNVPSATPYVSAPSVAKPTSKVVKFRRYRDPAHLNPELVPGGAVILAFPQRRANGVDPTAPRAHAS